MSDASPVLLFDGVCNLCNRSVQFVLEHEAAPTVHFASVQSEAGKALSERHGLPVLAEGQDPDSMVWIEGGHAYVQSSAALRLARHLKAPWRWLSIGLWVPRPLRDLVYKVIARNRYAWFGKSDSCLVPSASLRARFL